MVYLTRPTGANLAALQNAESKTNAAAGCCGAALNSRSTMDNASRRGEAGHHRPARATWPGLPALRVQIRAQIITRAHAPSPTTTPSSTGGYAVLEPGDPAGDQRQAGHPGAGLRADGQVRGDAAARGRAGARRTSPPARSRRPTASSSPSWSAPAGSLYAQTLPDLDRAVLRLLRPRRQPAGHGPRWRPWRTGWSGDTRRGRPPARAAGRLAAAVGSVAAGLSQAGHPGVGRRSPRRPAPTPGPPTWS